MESALRRSAPGDLKLIETLPLGAGGRASSGCRAHLARLARGGGGARDRGFDRGAVERALAEVSGGEALRVRLTLALDGAVAVAAAPLGPAKPVWTVVVAADAARLGRPVAGGEVDAGGRCTTRRGRRCRRGSTRRCC